MYTFYSFEFRCLSQISYHGLGLLLTCFISFFQNGFLSGKYFFLYSKQGHDPSTTAITPSFFNGVCHVCVAQFLIFVVVFIVLLCVF